MDTDDLSIEAYNAVIIKAEMFHHDLTLQFGVLASDCKNEDEYLKKSLLLIEKLENNPKEIIKYIFYENIPKLSKFQLALKGLKKSIKEVQEIPIVKRTFEEW